MTYTIEELDKKPFAEIFIIYYYWGWQIPEFVHYVNNRFKSEIFKLPVKKY
jgi:hypothetical protein